MDAYRVELGEDERRDLEALAARLRADEPALDRTWPFGAAVRPGLGRWPALLVEDHSGLGLYDPADDRAYGQRPLLLAEAGDWLAIGGARNPAFETYARDVLGLGRVEVAVPAAAPDRQPLARRCVADPALIDRLATVARRSGGLNLLPYMGIGGVWSLAGAIAAAAGCEVRVAAPPPRLTRRVNDKLWFAQRVAELFGRQALPPAYPAFGLSALVRRARVLATHHAQVAVKVPDSAAAAGNLVLDAGDVLGRSPVEVRADIAGLLGRAGWRGGFPLVVTGWEQPIVASPSVQLWIPDRSEGAPLVEGIFDQRLVGAAGTFAGAVPSALPEPWQVRLAGEAVRIATLFQELGYFGRCSFDAIIVGDGPPDWRLHWIECNGRWGGVSIPMTLASRLFGDWRRHDLVILDRAGLHARPQAFADFLPAIDDLLLVPGERDRGVVVLTPGRIEAGIGFDLMVVDHGRAEADALADLAATRALDAMGLGDGG